MARQPEARESVTAKESEAGLEDDPLWYKDAVIYELHVRAFSDSNGDGIGDFPGLTQKLDYLQDLGVTAIWLLPFYPSPLRDDGYDIADYTDVNPAYGTLDDFKTFLARGAPARPARHHRARAQPHLRPAPLVPARAPRARRAARERDFYVWSDTPERYTDARIIFKDFEPSNWTWDPVAKAYYWHRFYPHQPDLNFDNPRGARRRCSRRSTSGSRWASTACASTRCPTSTSARARTARTCPRRTPSCKSCARTSTQRFPNRMLLAEANQWPEDAVAYFGNGDECHMTFHFPLMPRLFMALQMEDRFPIIDILEPDAGHPADLPVGALPAQPRRADARDGDRRGARLHVPRLRRPTRRRASTSASAAASRRCSATTAADRADERAALLAAGHARHLLRRRDRHGRQHLPRRPQRRAHADAVERRPQRRLLAREPAAALPARRSSTPSTTTRRSTSRRSRATRTRCSGG